jgi:hypothetical protein
MPARRTFAQHYASKRNLASQTAFVPTPEALAEKAARNARLPRLGVTKPDAASTSPLLTGVKREEA